MRNIRFLIVFMVLRLTVPVMSAPMFDIRTSFHSTGGWDLEDLLEYITDKAHCKCIYSATVTLSSKTGAKRSTEWRGVFNDVEVGRLLACILTLEGLSAEITNNTIFVYETTDGSVKLPGILNGEWNVQSTNMHMHAYFGTNTVTIKKSNWEAVTLIEWVCDKGNVSSYVIDASISTNRHLVGVAFDKTPLDAAVMSSMAELHIECVPWMGGLLFRTQTGKRVNF